MGSRSRRFFLVAACGALLLQVLAAPARSAGTVVFADAFSGSSLNLSKWQIVEKGCNSAKNVTVSNGRLQLRDGPVGATTYCGSKVMARHLLRAPLDISARIRFDLPQGAHQGMPLFGTKCAWPCGGEIDSVEEINKLQSDDNVSIWTACATNPQCGQPKHPQRCGAASHYQVSASLSGSWHVYGITWLPDSVTWNLDGRPIFTMTMQQLEAMGCTTPFDESDNPFHLFLSNSTGGPWAGAPGGPGYPDFMLVDWIRITKA
jgi:hypothetical protein